MRNRRKPKVKPEVLALQPKPEDFASFFASFRDPALIAARKAQLEKLGMDAIEYGHNEDPNDIPGCEEIAGFELPSCRWCENSDNSQSVANYRDWPDEAPGLIEQTKDSGWDTCMLTSVALADMPGEQWDALIDRIEGIKNDYPLLNDSTWSEVEQEKQDKAWASYYRKEFQDEMRKKFGGVFLTYDHGEERQAQFDAMLEDDAKTDSFFHTYMQNSSTGCEWSEEDSGSMYLGVGSIVDGIDTHDVEAYFWPESPQQLKFKFPAQAEALVRTMFSDDLMVMLDAPTAHRIVDSLLEDEGPKSYSCVMINLPEAMAKQITDWGRLNVKDEDVIVDERGGKGREMEPHVTVLYGLLDDEPSRTLEQVFENTAPFEIKLGPCSVFKCGNHDVLKMEVISPDLHALNRNIRAVVAYENDFPDYKPHVTIAYCQPGTADRFEGASPWDDTVKLGQTTLGRDGVFMADKVVFSSLNDKKTTHGLGQGILAAKGVKSALNEATPGWVFLSNWFTIEKGVAPTGSDDLLQWVSAKTAVFTRETGVVFDGSNRAMEEFNRWLENSLIMAQAVNEIPEPTLEAFDTKMSLLYNLYSAEHGKFPENMGELHAWSMAKQKLYRESGGPYVITSRSSYEAFMSWLQDHVTMKAALGESWKLILFEKNFGRKPVQPGELTKWLRESAQAYYRATGKIVGLKRWIAENTEGMTDDEMAAFVAQSGALDTPVKASHRTIRRKVGRHVVDKVEIWRGNDFDITRPGYPRNPPKEGNIRITYFDNGRADSPKRIWTDGWNSYPILKWSLRNWRNLYGAPLFVDGKEAGTISYRNPALVEMW